MIKVKCYKDILDLEANNTVPKRIITMLKEELVSFCKANELPATGSKTELTERIACFLDTGKVTSAPKTRRSTNKITDITLDNLIEPNFVCSEVHRAFFKEQIGASFSFNVAFQKWL